MIRIIPAIILASSVSHAQSAGNKMSVMSVLPFSNANLSDVIVDSQVRLTRTDSSFTYLDIYLSCFGTNLRGVSNPLALNGTVSAIVTYQAADGGYKDYRVVFPSSAAYGGSSGSANVLSSQVLDASGNPVAVWEAKLSGNLIRATMRDTKTQSVDVTSSGTVYGKVEDVKAKSSLISGVRFEQTVSGSNGQYMGQSGALSANLNWYASENGKYITMYASFPGENKLCGGYYSPLMLSFDSEGKPPTLSKNSDFLLDKDSKKILKGSKNYSWPDFKDRQIYFLALDVNKNGKIEGGHQLFGDINGYKSGFENLAIYDENKDGVIDKKDKIFDQLLLWRDVNEDGKSQKTEVFKLSDLGVESISLEYKDETRRVGDRGKILGPASFEYKDKKGEKKKGYVWDVFLTLVPR